MASGFWASRERNRLMMLAAALIVVIAATAYTQIRLNAWSKPFYDALTRKDLVSFGKQLGVFAELAGVLLFLTVAQAWLRETSRVVLREGLVHDLMTEWLKPLRAFRLSNAGWIGVNPDQRLHADARRLTELLTDLGIGLLQSTLLLLSFIGVLWVLSRGMIFPVAGHRFHVPGYMVWCALLYAGTASLVSWLVGRPLAELNAERYAREAELRSNLVRVNEEIEEITIHGAEADEKDHLNRLFAAVLEVSRRMVRAITRLTWITAGSGWFSLVAPILVAAPSYLSGEMTFGELMVVVGAFNQVQSSLRWFVDNFPSLADWRATLVRVASFRSALVTMDSVGREASRIELLESADGSIQFDDLHVEATTGSVSLNKAQVHMKPGERILIVSERTAGRTALFRAIIGIWPWGGGRIRRPARQAVMFLSGRAHLPPGTLRAALAYPRSAADYDDATIAKALSDVGLEHLRHLLDSPERWVHRLSDDDKQCLAFARAILQRPRWLVLNGALEALEVDSRQRIRSLFLSQLAGIGLINIGQESGDDALFTERLHLISDPQARSFNLTEGHGTLAPNLETG
jgi:putative ATP-binding cassette transporter